MARNRKNQSAAVRLAPALKALLLCLLFGGSGVGYVWQKDQIQGLGKQIKQREIRLKSLVARTKDLQDQLDFLRSSRMLENRVKELNLGLIQPQPEQIWRLELSIPVRETEERQYSSAQYWGSAQLVR